MSRFSDAVNAARDEVDAAIEALERVPKNYGGHREADSTSTIDAVERDVVLHRDGRVMRFVRFLDAKDTPYLTALVTYRGRWIVVPSYKLVAVG